MAPKAGDAVPDVQLVHLVNEKPEKVSLRDLFKGKKGILVGVPGAFTPGCSKTHLPGYINDYEKLKAAGNEITVLLTVNDPFVADAWATSAGAQGKVDVYADPAGEAVKALGVEFDATPFLGNVRSARFSAVVQDGTFKTFNLEDGGGLTCSLSNQILAQLKDA
uniref:Glutaredoxin-dependent peroxiredoxin n=1 Tax=Auxenochlorella protothecoides TaxID=3075 RepID=A0A1D2A0T5_AUXPR